MARLVVCDQSEYIYFSEGAIPSPETLIERFPARSGPSIPYQELPADLDERRAWLMTLHAYQIANRKGYLSTERPPLETWIIGKPRSPSAKFARWFEQTSDDYRLLVHRSPLSSRGFHETKYWSHSCWFDMYTRLGIHRRRMQKSDMMGPVAELLQRVHHAYKTDPSMLDELFDSIGHEFAHSRGPTTGYNKRLWRTS